MLKTREEHNVLGGLGSAVAEILVEQLHCRQVLLGIQDTFGESGKPQELFHKYQINATAIRQKVMKLLEL